MRSSTFLPINVRETGPGRTCQVPVDKRAVARATGSKIARAMGGLTDQQVLDLRGMHQFQGVSAKALAERFNKPPHSVYALLKYTTRSHLEPQAADYPRGAVGRVGQ